MPKEPRARSGAHGPSPPTLCAGSLSGLRLAVAGFFGSLRIQIKQQNWRIFWDLPCSIHCTGPLADRFPSPTTKACVEKTKTHYTTKRGKWWFVGVEYNASSSDFSAPLIAAGATRSPDPDRSPLQLHKRSVEDVQQPHGNLRISVGDVLKNDEQRRRCGPEWLDALVRLCVQSRASGLCDVATCFPPAISTLERGQQGLRATQLRRDYSWRSVGVPGFQRVHGSQLVGGCHNLPTTAIHTKMSSDRMDTRLCASAAPSDCYFLFKKKNEHGCLAIAP